MKHRIESSFWVPFDLDAVWDFASRPSNLAKISPPEMNIEVSFEGESFEGLEFDIKIKPPYLPFPIEWKSRIQELNSTGDERRFVDIQLKGPFVSWRHEHKFARGTRDVNTAGGAIVRSLNPGTWITDSVSYEMPAGVLGTIANAIAVKHILGKMFADRKVAVLKTLSV